MQGVFIGHSVAGSALQYDRRFAVHNHKLPWCPLRSKLAWARPVNVRDPRNIAHDSGDYIPVHDRRLQHGSELGFMVMEGFVPIIETHATVTVYFPEDDPRDFGGLMGVPEGEANLARGSERRPPGRPHWSLRSQGQVDGETDDHIRWLLDRREPSREDLLTAIERGAEARLWIYWLADNPGPHVWISDDVVKRVADLNLSLHVDAYREDT